MSSGILFRFKEFLILSKIAHDKNITLNELCNNILEQYVIDCEEYFEDDDCEDDDWENDHCEEFFNDLGKNI